MVSNGFKFLFFLLKSFRYHLQFRWNSLRKKKIELFLRKGMSFLKSVYKEIRVSYFGLEYNVLKA